MNTQKLTLGALGVSPWAVMDSTKQSFLASVGCYLTPGAVLTFSVQHTTDNPFLKLNPVSITRVTTVVTINLPNHNATTGDTVIVGGANVLTGDVFDGQFPIASVVDANNFTYTVVDAGSLAAKADSAVTILRVRNHPTVTGATAGADATYNYPVRAIRVAITAYTSGQLVANVNQGTSW